MNKTGSKPSTRRATKQLDLYNFETSDECIKLNFSFEKENVSPQPSKRRHTKNPSKISDISVSKVKANKPTPAFEFFSTKTKRRKSDSGVFMTPSPLILDPIQEKNSQKADKKGTPKTSRKPKSHSSEYEKDICPMPLKKESKNAAVKNNIKTEGRKRKHLNDEKSVSNPRKKTKMIKGKVKPVEKERSSPRISARQGSSIKEVAPNSKKIVNSSKPQLKAGLTASSFNKESTSTPSMPLRSRSTKNSKTLDTESMMSPPKVSPVLKVDSSNGGFVKSPDLLCGSPSFNGVCSSSILQESVFENEKSRSDSRSASGIKHSDEERWAKSVKSKRLSKEDQAVKAKRNPVRVTRARVAGLKQSIPKKAAIEKTLSKKKIKSESPPNLPETFVSSENTEPEQEHNSLLEGSMFDPDSPIKIGLSKPPLHENRVPVMENVFAQDITNDRNDAELTPSSDISDDVSRSRTATNGYSAQQRTNNMKKRGRYSTSRLDAWAREVNEQFEDFESYELSID